MTHQDSRMLSILNSLRTLVSDITCVYSGLPDSLSRSQYESQILPHSRCHCTLYLSAHSGKRATHCEIIRGLSREKWFSKTDNLASHCDFSNFSRGDRPGVTINFKMEVTKWQTGYSKGQNLY